MSSIDRQRLSSRKLQMKLANGYWRTPKTNSNSPKMTKTKEEDDCPVTPTPAKRECDFHLLPISSFA